MNKKKIGDKFSVSILLMPYKKLWSVIFLFHIHSLCFKLQNVDYYEPIIHINNQIINLYIEIIKKKWIDYILHGIENQSKLFKSQFQDPELINH